MATKHLILGVLLLCAPLVLGCADNNGDNGGGTGGVAGGGVGGGGRGGRGGGGNGGGGTIGGVDAGNPDGSSDGASEMRPPPPVGANAERIVPGRVSLIGGGSGTPSCTNQSPAPADRWCGFYKAGALGRTELWVVNVTKAAMGTAIQCSGSDSNCLRLTTNLWTDTSTGFSHPDVHQFNGDTLIFYADATSSAGFHFVGPIYAWRPGWPAARQISTSRGYNCAGSATSESAMCLDNVVTLPVGSPTPTELRSDFMAGRLMNAAVATLPTVATNLLVVVAAEPSGTNKYGFSMTRDGRYAVWSARPNAPTDPEVLWAQEIGSASKTLVATNVSRWRTALDGRSYYWLRTFNYDLMNPSGTLMKANLPDGSAEAMLASNVAAHGALFNGTDTDVGMVFLSNVVAGKGELRVMVDPADPQGSTRLLDTGVAAIRETSRNLGFAVYSKTYNSDTTVGDLFVRRLDASRAPCNLGMGSIQATTFGLRSLLSNGGLLLWADNVDTSTGVGEGWVTATANCSSSRFTSTVDRWVMVGDQGAVYSDESDGTFSTIRYAETPGGTTWPSGNTVVQQAARATFSVLQPDAKVVVFTIDLGHDGVDGLYINKMLPF